MPFSALRDRSVGSTNQFMAVMAFRHNHKCLSAAGMGATHRQLKGIPWLGIASYSWVMSLTVLSSISKALLSLLHPSSKHQPVY